MWNDGLKSYNGSATFTYDAIGNPLTYNNGSAYIFTWQNGRQLASATKGSTTYTYTYNADGLRTRKTVGSTVYNYYWQGSQLVAMTLENSSGVVTATYKFYYDSNGLPFIFDYNGTIYYYVTNLQGDVVGLADEYGISARYTYDAWGNIIKMDAATNAPYSALMANPLRYRGYIYDTETGFYYLQSRYYDPEVGRFINADEAEYLGANGDINSYNLYAYCSNNPVNNMDTNGCWTVSIGSSGFAYLLTGATYSYNLTIDSDYNLAFQKSKADVMSNRGGVTFGLLGLGLAQNVTVTDFDTYEDLEGVGNSVNLSIVDVINAGMVYNDDWELHGVTISNPVSVFSTPLPVDGTIESSVTETIYHVNIKDKFSKLKGTLSNWWESFKNIWGA